MPPRSPLPQRRGVDAARLHTGEGPGPAPWATMGEWLRHRLPDGVAVTAMLERGSVVDQQGRPVRASDPYRANMFVWFPRDLPDEPVVPGSLAIVYRDERILVVDKPAFLATTPRGGHVRESAVVRLRDELGLPDLVSAHRLDRLTSGLLLLVVEQRWRGAYQRLFQEHAVRKIYRAIAPLRTPGGDLPVDHPLVVRNRIEKRRGVWQAAVVPGPANAQTLVEREAILEDPGPPGAGRARYRLAPATGRTHQLRVHLAGLGLPIQGDPLYPAVREVAVDDFTQPLQLLAAELAFVDPVDGRSRRFRSARRLPLFMDEGGAAAEG